jgi:hypothetical protein
MTTTQQMRVLFEDTHGRRPNTAEELAQWIASTEGRSALDAMTNREKTVERMSFWTAVVVIILFLIGGWGLL